MLFCQLNLLVLASAFFLDKTYPIFYIYIRHLVLFLPELLDAVYPKSIAFRTELIIKSNESDALFLRLTGA
jgi:hypothetical protein